MINPFEKNGFTEIQNSYKDIEIYQKKRTGLISMKKFKNDIKAHRQSGNHLDHRLINEIKSALNLFENDDSIGSLIITSSHKVAFSRGAKIEDILGATQDKCRDFLSKAQDLIIRVQSFKKPVIAAINGLTLGGGFELALACDYRIASTRENVIFGFPETSLGLIPAMGGTQNLSRIIGKKEAETFISDSVINITTEDALKLNIVEKAVPPGDLISEAYNISVEEGLQKRFDPYMYKAQATGQNINEEMITFFNSKELKSEANELTAPLARALVSFLYDKTDDKHYMDGLRYECEVFCYLQQTEDCQEGIQALIDERKPAFKGR